MYIVVDEVGRRIDTGMVKTFKVNAIVSKPDEMSDDEFMKTGFNHRIYAPTFTWTKNQFIDQEFDVIDDLNLVVDLMKKYDCEAIRVTDSDIASVDKIIQLHSGIGYYD